MKYTVNALILASVLCLVAGCSSGSNSASLGQATPAESKVVDGFTLSVWDESFVGNDNQGRFSLEVIEAGKQKIIEVEARGLLELDALYLSIGYDPRAFHPQDVTFTNPLGASSEVLQLHHLHHPGELQIGQVLIHPESKAGLSGDLTLLQVVFESGAAPLDLPVKKVSAASGGGPAVVWHQELATEMSWTFGGLGDYDQNGEVNIADLTPIAVNFGVSGSFDPLDKEYVVDGDGNGEINLADITPIVLHFGEVTEGYDLFLRRPSEITQPARSASFAADPLISLEKSDRIDADGVFLMSFDPLNFSGQIYDDELVSISQTNGNFSVSLGDEHALIEVAPRTTVPGDRPSTYVGGDPALMPHVEWETQVLGNGTYADPFRASLSSFNSFRLLDDSSQDVSAVFSFNGIVNPPLTSLYDSVHFGKVNSTTGDWPFELAIDAGEELAHDWPTKMVLSFVPVTPGEGTAANFWVTYDLINSGPDYWLEDFLITPNPAPANWPIRLDGSTSSIPGSMILDYSWEIEELGVDDIMDVSVINADEALSILWLSIEGGHNIRLRISDDPEVSGLLAPFDRTCYIIESPFGSDTPIPVANATPQLIEPGQQSVLIGTDSSHPQSALGYKIVDYYWSQTGLTGTGTAIIDDPYSEVSSVAFSGDAQGTFSFTLHALDNIGTTAVDTVEVVVETISRLPVAAFSIAPNPVTVNNQVSFDAAASYHEDPLYTVVEYRWDFDEDGTIDFTSATPDAVHTFTESGDQLVWLTVLDDNEPAVNNSISHAVQVDPIPNDPPSPQLVADSSPSRINREVTLDASGSSDSDGTIIRYEFDVDGDNNYEYDGTESIVVHTYTATLDLWATVRITDDDGAVRIASAPMQILPEPSWHISTIDDGDGTNDVGRNAHLAIVDGFPAIAYYDSTAQDLKFVRAKNSRGWGDWRNGIVVENTPGVDDGHYPVLFQTGSNPPVIGFHDATNGELKVIPALDTAGLTWGSATMIDGTIGNAGQGLSGITGATFESLAYFDTSTNKLMFIQATNEAGTTWDSPVEVFQAIGAIGTDAETAISINTNGMPCITTQIDGDATLHVATTTDGSAWNPKVVIQVSAGSSALTGFLPPSAYGMYYDTVASEVRFELASLADGSVWNETPATIGSLVDAGELALFGPDQTQGLRHENYLEYIVIVGSPSLGLLAYSTEDAQGASWDSAGVIDSGVGAGALGLSMLVADELPAIAWWDQENGQLKYAYYD